MKITAIIVNIEQDPVKVHNSGSHRKTQIQKEVHFKYRKIVYIHSNISNLPTPQR